MASRLSLTNLVLAAGILGALLVPVWGIRVGVAVTSLGQVLYIGLPILVAVMCVISLLWLSEEWRTSIAIGLISVAGFLIGAEIFFQWEHAAQVRSNTLESHNDSSTAQEIASRRDALAIEGKRAFPHFCATHFITSGLRVPLGEDSVVPLTGMARNTIFQVLPNGRITQGRTDRFGFNNPDSVWDDSESDVVAFTGDSFTFGADLPFGSSFVDRARGPDRTVINLACGGNGPITELAVLKEYGPISRPRLVFWVYFEGNDLTKDIGNEAASAELLRYIDVDKPMPNQLATRQRELDKGLSNLAAQPGASKTPGARHGFSVNWKYLLSLTTLRTRLGMSLQIEPSALSLFERVIVSAKSTVDSWGGRLVFIYLPSEVRFTNPLATWHAEDYAGLVRNVVTEADIPIIDIANTLADHPDPRVLYDGHFNEIGARIVADRIDDAIEATN